MSPVLAPTFMLFPTHHKSGGSGGFGFPLPQRDADDKESNENGNNAGDNKDTKNDHSDSKNDNNNDSKSDQDDDRSKNSDSNKSGNSSSNNKEHDGDDSSNSDDDGGGGDSHAGGGTSSSGSTGNTGGRDGSDGSSNNRNNSSNGSGVDSQNTSSDSSSSVRATSTQQGSDEGPPITSLPSSSTRTSSFFPSSTSSFPAASTDIPAPSVDPPPSHSKILPSGSIVAIILGILFCITLGCVIYIFTRPKFGRIKRFWKRSISRSWVSHPYQYPIPTTESSFGNKEMGFGYVGSDYYRPIYETAGPSARSIANLRAFRFGGRGSNSNISQADSTQMPQPLPAARQPSSSRSRSGEMSMAPSSSSRARSIFSSQSRTNEYPSTRYTFRTSFNGNNSSNQQHDLLTAEHVQNLPWSIRSSMSSVALSRQTIIIPHRYSLDQHPLDISAGADLEEASAEKPGN